MRNITEFRDGIFALQTRRFGSVAEIMIKKLFHFTTSKDINFDLLDDNGTRIEVKFSRAMKANRRKITEKNIIQECCAATTALRTMKASETDMYKFDSNIEQVKCEKFDVLYYGLFFSDFIEIYKKTNEEVKLSEGYSSKQHSKGAVKSIEEGQFHLNQATINSHRNFLVKKITYNELYNLLKQ